MTGDTKAVTKAPMDTVEDEIVLRAVEHVTVAAMGTLKDVTEVALETVWGANEPRMYYVDVAETVDTMVTGAVFAVKLLIQPISQEVMLRYQYSVSVGLADGSLNYLMTTVFLTDCGSD